MENNAIALRDQSQLPQTLEERKRQTDLTIDTATYWAKKLMQVVDGSGLSRQMGNKKYLEVEGWQVIAEFAQVKAIIEWTRPWADGSTGDFLGYEARCKLVDAMGEVVGAGESSCGLDAFPCKGKSGSEKDKAARSAAQTWAISRALRNKFSFVAKLAGYQPVPAEEMPHDNGEPSPLPQSAPKVAVRASQTAKKALADMILEYTKQDKTKASAVLIAISGKPSLRDMTEQQAEAAIDTFTKLYLTREPGDDDIPDYLVPSESGIPGAER